MPASGCDWEVLGHRRRVGPLLRQDGTGDRAEREQEEQDERGPHGGERPPRPASPAGPVPGGPEVPPLPLSLSSPGPVPNARVASRSRSADSDLGGAFEVGACTSVIGSPPRLAAGWSISGYVTAPSICPAMWPVLSMTRVVGVAADRHRQGEPLLDRPVRVVHARIGDAIAAEEGQRAGGGVLDVVTEEGDPMRAVLLVQVLERLALATARGAPGAPDVEYHDLAAVAREVDRRAGQRGRRESGAAGRWPTG